jgi:predicted membrane-bound spermidine synthase
MSANKRNNRSNTMRERDIVITVSVAAKTCEVYIDGAFKFCDQYKYAENAIQAAHAYADQHKHHAPKLSIDLRGATA